MAIVYIILLWTAVWSADAANVLLGELNQVDGTICGADGGEPFDDFDYFQQYGHPSKILVRSADVIDAVQFWYGEGDEEAPRHGGDGGDVHEYTMGIGEYISGVAMKQLDQGPDETAVVCQISFFIVSPDGRINEFGPLGRCEPDWREMYDCGTALFTTPMKYIRGRSAHYLDKLEAVF